ncbi:MAG: hypothetical protein HFI35_15925 [Roseburia sp.]|nr:hypothetical protein [Roseburia sp.]
MKRTADACRAFLTDEMTPQASPAVEDLVSQSLAYTKERPLCVIAIGAIINIASAMPADPDIVNCIVQIWPGGSAVHWPDTKEFNPGQDVAAAGIVFGCGVPLVQRPCMGVVSAFTTRDPEPEYHLKGRIFGRSRSGMYPIRYVCHIHRDRVFEDLFRKLPV